MDNFPKLEENQYAVLACEVKTGIVLNIQGSRAKAGENHFLVFHRFEDALEFIQHEVSKHGLIEYSVYNNLQECCCVARNSGWKSLVFHDS
jgi:hypothetical protein